MGMGNYLYTSLFLHLSLFLLGLVQKEQWLDIFIFMEREAYDTQ